MGRFIQVGDGELVSVVGPNGAGKHTLINVIAGMHRARAGQMRFAGRDITTLASHRFCDAGIAIVPEGRRLFTTQMTVRDNTELGSFTRRQGPSCTGHEQVLALFPALVAKLQSPAGTLSGGQQQMVLAIGRALMSHPSLLLLDEPSPGLAPLIVQGHVPAIRTINDGGLQMLLVETGQHGMTTLASRACDGGGRIVAEGPAAELMSRPEIQQASGLVKLWREPL